MSESDVATKFLKFCLTFSHVVSPTHILNRCAKGITYYYPEENDCSVYNLTLTLHV